MLAGGEGRRVGGLDKGLVPWRGQPLGRHVLQRLAPQASQWLISANRHADDYARLAQAASQAPCDVFPDDADLPPRSGPLAGMVTALRRAPQDWLQFVPCDAPLLPVDLVSRLWAEAQRSACDVVVPLTHDDDGQVRPHWVCALVHRRTLPALTHQFAAGERKVSRWIGSQVWRSVSFADAHAFANINALEHTDASR